MKQTVEHVFYADFTSHPIAAPSTDYLVVETKICAVYDNKSGYTHITFKHLVAAEVNMEEPTFDGLHETLTGFKRKDPGSVGLGSNLFS